MELILSELQRLSGKFDSELQKINGRLGSLESKVDRLQEDITELKEDAEITREGVNKVAEWADNAGFLLKIPFGQPGK